jgi:hypothetical protein
MYGFNRKIQILRNRWDVLVRVVMTRRFPGNGDVVQSCLVSQGLNLHIWKRKKRKCSAESLIWYIIRVPRDHLKINWCHKKKKFFHLGWPYTGTCKPQNLIFSVLSGIKQKSEKRFWQNCLKHVKPVINPTSFHSFKPVIKTLISIHSLEACSFGCNYIFLSQVNKDRHVKTCHYDENRLAKRMEQ